MRMCFARQLLPEHKTCTVRIINNIVLKYKNTNKYTVNYSKIIDHSFKKQIKNLATTLRDKTWMKNTSLT